MQSVQFNKQSQGGTIITQLINLNDFDTHLLFLYFPVVAPPALTSSPTHHLSIQIMLPIIYTLPLLIYDVMRTGS